MLTQPKYKSEIEENKYALLKINVESDGETVSWMKTAKKDLGAVSAITLKNQTQDFTVTKSTEKRTLMMTIASTQTF